MDPTNPTDPSACASPDGAPPTLTAVAGAQTERPVILDIDWPGYAAIPGQPMRATVPGTATIAIAGRVVTVGLELDAGGTDRPYVARHDESTTWEQDERIDRAVADAWAVAS